MAREHLPMDMNKLRIKALQHAMGDLSQAAFADRYDISASHISQILSGHRPFGERAAQNMEDKIGLPRGALSNPSTATIDGSTAGSFIVPARAGEIDIPQYDVRAAMGHGQVLPSDYIETIRHVTVGLDFLQQQGCVVSSSKNLCIITGFGESMHKTFSSGDPLIIDRGVTSVEIDGVYLISLDNHLMVKRIQIISDGVKIISDHESYIPHDVTGKDLERLIVHARVLLAWHSQKL